MKTCSICKEEKDLKDFNRNACKKDGLQTMCRPCSNLISKKYYNLNPEKHKQNVKKRKKLYVPILKDLVADIKENSKCYVCPENTPCTLDFHHTRDKKFLISRGKTSAYSFSTFEGELAKCILLCSNCHRKLHNNLFSLWPRQLASDAELVAAPDF